ncbi:MAG: OmpA family protein [Rhodospirillales bacterium]|jgi:outer membrane protein OmpA-like peptidoglycan-associated protein|nr:OmpA family protein [Rhodospirillales bacterium]
MNKRPIFHRAIPPIFGWGPFAVFSVFLGAQTLSVSDAVAQSSGGYASDNPYVTVDLSVLDASSSAAASKSFAPGAGYSGTLVIPGPASPVSRLHVTPKGGGAPIPATDKNRVVLRAPTTNAVVPPATPPVSNMDIPGKTLPEPSPEKSATPEKPAVKPMAKPAAAPPAKPEPVKPAKPAVPQMAAKQADAPPPEPAVAPPAPPPPPEAAKPAPEPAKVAALTPAAEKKADGSKAEVGTATKIIFDAGVSKLPTASRDILKGLVDNVIDDSNLRLQLLAYAGGESLSSSKARRLSLSRALSVRSFLIESGLRSTRIDVRALGDRTDEKPVNRVDINVVER